MRKSSPVVSKQPKLENITVVDLFCGVGGLTHGFIKEKFNVVAGVDFDETCKYAYEQNNKAKFLHEDITSIDSQTINALYPKGHKKILVGCAPCQPFSLYAHARKSEDEKWKLLYSFARIIEEIKPDIISMENVPQLASFNKGKVLEDFKATLKKAGYKVSHYIVNAQNYGVPQRRKRLLLFASLEGEIEIIPETHKKKFKTVKDAIGHLPEILDGQSDAKDRLHCARKLSELNKKRIIATPHGGRWKDWKDKSLILECHKKESGKAFGSVYGRMHWDDVSPTLTTCCVGLSNGRFGHPEQNRAISLREAAILQSFPAKYKFVDKKAPFSSSLLARHIGNAVPVTLGKVVAKTIKKHLESIGSQK